MGCFHYRKRQKGQMLVSVVESPKCFRETPLGKLNKVLLLHIWEANVKSYSCRGQDSVRKMLPWKYYRDISYFLPSAYANFILIQLSTRKKFTEPSLILGKHTGIGFCPA